MTNPSTGKASGHQYSSGAVGVISFAGVLMIIAGVFHVVQAIIALVDDKFYVVGPDYVFQFDLTTWGWIHLIAGIVVGLAGAALFAGVTWARVVAVIVAGVSIIANFMWMPWYPFWAITVIAFDVFVIWAVTAHGRDVLEAG
jgi:hypothetical protein